MDETKGIQQDNPVVETPEGEKGTTPEVTPETLAEQVKHIKEVALADVGRYRVATEKAVKAASNAETRLTQFIKNQEEAELAAAGDDSEKLTTIRERQGRRTAETELAKTKSELEEEKAKTTEAQEVEAKHTKEQNAREVATRLQVDAKTLIEFTDGSVEAMEKLANKLPKKGETKTLTPDSGKTTGGSASFEKIRDDMIKNPSNDAKMKRYMDAKKAQEG